MVEVESTQLTAPGQPAVTPIGSPIGRATVRVPGVCGELVQGMLGQSHFLVTCPVDFYSRITVEIFAGEAGVSAPPDCPKSIAGVAAALAHLGRTDVAVKLTIGNSIPRSKGMGSSSADVAGAIAATGLALGQQLSPSLIGELALLVEPTDGVMFPGIALFDHREGSIVEEMGPPPPMEIVAIDFGGTVDTLEFNQIDHYAAWHSLESANQQALDLVRQGVHEGNPALVGQGASISAEAGQRILDKPQLPRVVAFAQAVGAVGVCVAHSGTIIGVLLDARERRGKSTFRQARAAFTDAEAVHHFRLMSGGVQVVE
ncbi:MAG: GHMP kinase [Chloroflexi bacterium]|nr:GHMP kinase [Chloroflexota bacterium]